MIDVRLRNYHIESNGLGTNTKAIDAASMKPFPRQMEVERANPVYASFLLSLRSAGIYLQSLPQTTGALSIFLTLLGKSITHISTKDAPANFPGDESSFPILPYRQLYAN